MNYTSSSDNNKKFHHVILFEQTNLKHYFFFRTSVNDWYVDALGEINWNRNIHKQDEVHCAGKIS